MIFFLSKVGTSRSVLPSPLKSPAAVRALCVPPVAAVLVGMELQ